MILDRSLQKSNTENTSIDGKPFAQSVSGYSHFNAHLKVAILTDNHSLSWWGDYARQTVSGWLQGLADSVRGQLPPPDVTGIPPNFGGPASYDANGELSGFTAKTGGMTHGRRIQSAASTIKLFTISQQITASPTQLRIQLTPAGKPRRARDGHDDQHPDPSIRPGDQAALHVQPHAACGLVAPPRQGRARARSQR